MSKKSTTDNVRKICGCLKWKTCPHPWHLDFTLAGKRCQRRLDRLVGREPTDYEDAVDEARRAIKALRDGRNPSGLVPEDQPTVAELLDAYLTEKPRAKAAQTAWQVAAIVRQELRSTAGPRPFGDWPVSTVTTAALKEFQQKRPLVAGNRDLALLRAAFNYAVLERLVATSPFRVGDVAAVRLKAEAGRTRRLLPGEEDRLLTHARGRLRAIIIAALETGCRKGELLSLQVEQIRFAPRAEIFLPAQKTKAKKDRRVPINSVLWPVLKARLVDPAGEPLPPAAFVFGNEIGEQIGSIQFAWRRLCRRAGIVGLHFHDLRREGASRWMDDNVPLATIQRWLGHHNISQTSTYLGASLGGDEQDMAAFDARRAERFTYNSLIRTQQPPKRTKSNTPVRRITNKNAKEPSGDHTIH